MHYNKDKINLLFMFRFLLFVYTIHEHVKFPVYIDIVLGSCYCSFFLFDPHKMFTWCNKSIHLLLDPTTKGKRNGKNVCNVQWKTRYLPWYLDIYIFLKWWFLKSLSHWHLYEHRKMLTVTKWIKLKIKI